MLFNPFMHGLSSLATDKNDLKVIATGDKMTASMSQEDLSVLDSITKKIISSIEEQQIDPEADKSAIKAVLIKIFDAERSHQEPA